MPILSSLGDSNNGTVIIGLSEQCRDSLGSKDGLETNPDSTRLHAPNESPDPSRQY